MARGGAGLRPGCGSGGVPLTTQVSRSGGRLIALVPTHDYKSITDYVGVRSANGQHDPHDCIKDVVHLRLVIAAVACAEGHGAHVLDRDGIAALEVPGEPIGEGVNVDRVVAARE